VPAPPSLRAFLDGEPDWAAIPNMRMIAATLLTARRTMSDREQAAEADHYDEQARTLETGHEYEYKLWNRDHWIAYDVVEPTLENATTARWISDALRDPQLAARLLALVPEDDLRTVRDQVEATTPERRPPS
jgi:hypothetical protein